MNMLRKHEGVINSLQIMACDTIKYLDKEHNQTTLRHFMMELTFPMSPTAGQKTKGLIHSIDFASSGPDAGAKVQVTAYADRAELVSSLLNILPAFIEYQLDEETMVAWFHHQAVLPTVEWETDEDGNWTGGWKTEDDLMFQQLVDEEMEGTIVFDNMGLVRKDRRILSAEDASMKSFNIGSEGRSAQSSNVTVDSEDMSTATVPAAHGESGTNTV